jgi:multicomponent K+:H+ antiporter subunit G
MNPLSLPLWLDVTVALLVLIGTAFALVGSIGLVRLQDFLQRLHGPSKATTLGVGSVLVASALWFNAQGILALHELLVTLFLFMTAPVSAHLLVKAAMQLAPGLRPPPPHTKLSDVGEQHQPDLQQHDQHQR